VTPFTPDELDLMAGDLSESDKNDAPAADAGATESVETDKDAGDFPLAEGVTLERATGYAIYDTRLRQYVGGSYRTRKPTKAMHDEAEKSGGRLEIRRV
jgi:hypothetical protein